MSQAAAEHGPAPLRPHGRHNAYQFTLACQRGLLGAAILNIVTSYEMS
jgi:hypothetical protein